MPADRDQAREELGHIVNQALAQYGTWGEGKNANDLHSTGQRGLDALLAHPDLVLRALNMEPLLEHALTRTALGDRGLWVEPPTDQDSGAET